MGAALETELQTYEHHRDELLGKFEGKYVLIHENRIVSVFDSKNDAIRQGYDEFGNVPFLVKQVVKVETPHNFVTNLLAV